jgi:hypothetical protein
VVHHLRPSSDGEIEVLFETGEEEEDYIDIFRHLNPPERPNLGEEVQNKPQVVTRYGRVKVV